MERGVGPRAYLAVLVGAGTYTLLLFSWFSLPAALGPIQDALGISDTAAGLLAGAVPLVYVPLGVASGLVVDRVGPSRSLAGGVAIVGVAHVWRAVAADFLTMLAATLLLGAGATAITFGLPKLVGELFPAREAGLPTSIYLVGASVGSAGAFAVGRPLLAPALGGWRPLFFWTGVVALVYAGLWLGTARLLGVRTASRSADRTLTRETVRRDLSVLLSHRDLRLIVVVATMYLLLVHGLQGWLPTLLEARGLDASLAGQATSLFVVASTAAVLVVPPLADRLDARREAVVLAGGLGVVGVAAIAGGGATLLAVGGIVVAGIGGGSLSPLIRSIPPDLEGVGAERTGAAMGIAFAVGEIGGVAGPLLVGALSDLTGSFVPGLAVLAAGAAVVVAAGLALGDV